MTVPGCIVHQHNIWLVLLAALLCVEGSWVTVRLFDRAVKGTLHDYVLAALAASGLSPNRLELEVTETALLDDERDVIGDLRRIRGLGVRVALDDFGTGYSSLAHLRAFPFDKIKIDGSFVKDAVERADCAAVVKAIADLGQRLGVTTVAERSKHAPNSSACARKDVARFRAFSSAAPCPARPTPRSLQD